MLSLTAPLPRTNTPTGQATGRTIPLAELILHAGTTLPITIINSLRAVFSLDFVDASAIMAEAVREGSALITAEPIEHAEFHQARLVTHSISSRVKKDDSLKGNRVEAGF